MINVIRHIQDHPKLSPVGGTSLIGLELRCRKAGQFAVVYSCFEPSAADPDGFISVRAIRHMNEEDVFYGVEEGRVSQDEHSTSGLWLE